MDDLELQVKPGLFSRLAGIFSRGEEGEEEAETAEGPTAYTLRSNRCCAIWARMPPIRWAFWH